MKKNNILKGMMPYIIINTLVYTILGAIIGKNIVEITNTQRVLDRDYKALKRFFNDIWERTTHFKPEEFEEVPADEIDEIRKAEIKEKLGEALVTLSETCDNAMSLEDFLKR